MKQTAVEWYAEQSMRLELERAKGNISMNEMLNQLSNVLEKAKEMEKEQSGYSEEDVKKMLYMCCDVLENKQKSFWNIDGLVDEIVLTFKQQEQ